jgi:hypothetical protein
MCSGKDSLLVRPSMHVCVVSYGRISQMLYSACAVLKAHTCALYVRGSQCMYVYVCLCSKFSADSHFRVPFVASRNKRATEGAVHRERERELYQETMSMT